MDLHSQMEMHQPKHTTDRHQKQRSIENKIDKTQQEYMKWEFIKQSLVSRIINRLTS